MSRVPLFVLSVMIVVSGAPELARAVSLAFPVENPGGEVILSSWVIGVDHDEADGETRADCLSYSGQEDFPFCYDGHRGTDFLLEGGFRRMDDGSAWVIAAADGEVVEIVDGNYDRCHGDMATGWIDCDGHEMRANVVRIRHDDGYETYYVHLMSGSIIVEVGDIVACGDRLARVGSSGISATPHLHFQVYAPDGSIIDPFAGPVSQEWSLWVGQDGDYGLPASRCEGEPEPGPDTGAPDVGRADVAAGPDTNAPDVGTGAPDLSSPEADAVVADSGADGGAPPYWSNGSGGGLFDCAVSPGGGSASYALLPLILLLVMRRRLGRRVRPS